MAQQPKTAFSEKDLDDIAVVWAQALQRKLQDLARAAAQNWHDNEEKKNEVKRLPRSPAFLKRLSYFLHPENQRKARAPVSSVNNSGSRKTYSSPVSTAPEVALPDSHSAHKQVTETKESLDPIRSDPLPVNQSHAASDISIPQKHPIASHRSRVRGPQERGTYSPQSLTPIIIPKIAQEQSEPQQSEFLTTPTRHISYHGPSPPVTDTMSVKHGNMLQGSTESSPGFFYGAEYSSSSFSKGDLFYNQWFGSRTIDSATLTESLYYDGTSEAPPLNYRSLTYKPLDFDSWAATGWVNAPTSNSQDTLTTPMTQEASRHHSPYRHDGSHPQNGDVGPSPTGFSVQKDQQDMEPQQLLLSRFPVTAMTPNVSRNNTPVASGPQLPSCLAPQPHSAESNSTVTTPISDSQFQPPQQYLDTSTAAEHRHLDRTTLQRLVTEPTIPAPPAHPTQHQKSEFRKRKLGEVDNEDGLASIHGNGIEASAVQHPTKKAKYMKRTPKTVRGDIK